MFGPYKDFESQLEIKNKLLNCSMGSTATRSIENSEFHRRQLDFAHSKKYDRHSVKAHGNMKARFKKQNTEIGLKKKRLRELATSSELSDLMRKSGDICAISGIRGCWQLSSKRQFPPPFFLTFDHIQPVSRGGSSSIHNVQIISYCLNQVKGNESNSELIRWIACFIKAQRSRLLEQTRCNEQWTL